MKRQSAAAGFPDKAKRGWMKAERQFAANAGRERIDETNGSKLVMRHRHALEQLACAYRARRPVAILTGPGRAETCEVVSAFVTSVDDDSTIIRITRPKTNVIEGMRQIIRDIGFEPCEMTRSDLEKVFQMFLAYQQRHQRRTILDVEEAQDQENWLLEQVSRLVEMEAASNYGLMVLLSGRPGLRRVVSTPLLQNVCSRAGRQIRIQRMNFDETRDLIRTRLAESGSSDIAELFEYEATTVIHELSDGIADEVERLYRQCLFVAQQQDRLPVTAEVVTAAVRQLEAQDDDSDLDQTADLPAVPAADLSYARVIVSREERLLGEFPLHRDRTLIGRDALCDIKLPSKLVSRHHALIVRTECGAQVLDLGSTNGVVVDGRKVRDYELEDGDVLRLADCCLEYRLE